MPPEPSAYLFDLDGTLYVGSDAVPGAADALDRLRRRGVPFRFVTNTTSRPRAELAERLRAVRDRRGARRDPHPDRRRGRAAGRARLPHGRAVLARGVARRPRRRHARRRRVRSRARFPARRSADWRSGRAMELCADAGGIRVSARRRRRWWRSPATAISGARAGWQSTPDRSSPGSKYAAGRDAVLAGKPSTRSSRRRQRSWRVAGRRS